MKEVVLGGLGQLLRRGPLCGIAQRYFEERASVVFYHGVWNESARLRLFGGVSTSEFEAHLRRLKSFFHILPLSQVIEVSREGRKTKRPVLAVTFDDGFDLTTGGATEVMDRLGIKGTVFVNTACLTGRHLLWMHMFSVIQAKRGSQTLLTEINRVQAKYQDGRTLSSLSDLIAATRAWPQGDKDHWAAAIWGGARMESLETFLNENRPYFSIEGLRDWTKRGHEVGFHTHSHPFCSQLTDALWESEILRPLSAFKAAINADQIAFAYPFGDRSPPKHEAKLRDLSIFTALMGTGGFSKKGEDLAAMERVQAEDGVNLEVFGKPLVRAYKQKLSRRFGHSSVASESKGDRYRVGRLP